MRIFLIKQRLPSLYDAEISVLRDVRLVLFDFDGVFTKNSVVVDEFGKESVECSRLDGIGLARLRACGIITQVISTEANTVVSARCKKLGIEVTQGVFNKKETILHLAKHLRLNLSQIMFVGNDINDIPAFNIVGVPVAVNDAYPDVIEFVSFLTERKGGEGCVREVCDILSIINERLKNA